VQLLVDGTLSNDAAITLNYASQAVASFNRRMAAERVGVPMGDFGGR
jgi:hypothetical protein